MVFRPLVLLVHPDAVSREILVGHLDELRWISASGARDLPAAFEEAPALLLGDADHVADLDAICDRMRFALPTMRTVALAGERRAQELANIDTVLVKPVGLDRLRKALLREARLWARSSGTRMVARAPSRQPADETDETDDHDPDDVVTRRVRY